MDVLVQVKSRQHNDTGRTERWIRGDRGSCADSITARHADVHQDDIGMFASDDRKRSVPVARCADHDDLRIRSEQSSEARAYELLVIDDHDGDHRGRSEATGRLAVTRNPPSWAGPADRLPPSASARSRIPVMPLPPPECGPRPLAAPSPSSRIATSTRPSWWSTCTLAVEACACRTTFVSASRVMRYTAAPAWREIASRSSGSLSS